MRRVVLGGSLVILSAVVIIVAPVVMAVSFVRSWLSPGYVAQVKERYTAGNVRTLMRF